MPETTLTAALIGFLVAAAALVPPLAIWVKVRSERDKFVTGEATKYEAVLERLHTVELAAATREGELANELVTVNGQLRQALNELATANQGLKAANVQIAALQEQVKSMNEQIAVLIKQKTVSIEVAK